MLLPPSRLAADRGPDPRDGFGFVDATIAVPSVPPGATLNDVLIAATALAVERWNAGHGRAAGRLSVYVPVNRRPPWDRLSGIRNDTGQAVVFSSPEERAGDQLLASVANQTRQAKARFQGQSGPVERTVGALQWLPASVRRRILRVPGRYVGRWVMPSITVSNLGRVDAFYPASGGTLGELRALVFLTTAGMPQGVTVTAARLGDNMHLAVTFARHKLGDRAGGSFLGLIVEAVRELTA